MQAVQNPLFILAFPPPLFPPVFFLTVRAQANGNLAGAVSQLLDHHAPSPPPKELAAMKEAAINTTDGDPPDPGEDAPIKVLIDYWGTQEMSKQPSEKVRQRL